MSDENEIIEDAPEEELSLRDVIEAKWDGEQEDATDSVGEAEEPLGRERDEKGRFKTKAIGDGDEPEREAGEGEAPEVAQGEPGEVAATPDEQPGEEQQLKAPQSWKPAAREHWNEIPDSVKEEVYRREHGMQQYLSQTAEERKLAQAFQQVYAPYEAIIRGEGADPITAVDTLLQTAYQLRQPDPVSKANLMANMIQRYGVQMHGEQFLQQLDQVLMGHVVPGMKQQQQPMPQQPMQDPRVDNILQALAGVQQENMTKREQAAHQELQSFSQGHEFLDDVRDTMADLMEAASRRGVDLSLEDAYNHACRLDPEIASVMEQRERAAAAGAQQSRTARARAAASSVGGAPTRAPKPDPGDMSRRDAIAAAIDAVSGG